MTLKELDKFFEDGIEQKLYDRKRGVSFMILRMPARKKLISEADALKYMNNKSYRVHKDQLAIFPVNLTLRKGKITIKRLDKKTIFGPDANAYILTRKKMTRKLYKWLSEDFA